MSKPASDKPDSRQWLNPGDAMGVLVATTIVLIAACVLTIYFVGRYQGAPFDATLLFGIADHPPTTERIQDYFVGDGSHVFGDFLVVYWGANTDPFEPFILPFGIELPYGPALLALSKLLFSFGTYRMWLWMFMAASVVLLAIPALWAARSLKWPNRVVVAVLFGLLPFPILWCLDRGNIQSLLLPWLFLAALWMERQEWTRASVALAVAASMKFYSFVIVLPMLFARKLRPAIAAAIAAAVITLIGFLFIHGSLWSSIETYWNVTVEGYWSGRMAKTDFGLFLFGNWSLAGALGRISVLGHFQRGQDFIASYPNLPGFLFFAFIAITLALSWRFLPAWARSYMYLSPISLTAPISTGYTFVWIVIPIAFAIRPPRPAEVPSGISMSKPLQRILLAAIAFVAAIKPTWSQLTGQVFPQTSDWINAAMLLDPIVMTAVAVAIGAWGVHAWGQDRRAKHSGLRPVSV